MPKKKDKQVQRVDPAARDLPAGQEANPEQTNYDIFVSQGIMLAGPAADKLQGQASVDLLGNSLFEIVKKVESEGMKNGIEFSLPVILNGSNEVLNHLINMTGTQLNDDQIKTVIGTAVGRYVQDKMQTGAWTPQQAQQIAQQAQQGMGQPQQQPGQLNPGMMGGIA